MYSSFRYRAILRMSRPPSEGGDYSANTSPRRVFLAHSLIFKLQSMMTDSSANHGIGVVLAQKGKKNQVCTLMYPLRFLTPFEGER